MKQVIKIIFLIFGFSVVIFLIAFIWNKSDDNFSKKLEDVFYGTKNIFSNNKIIGSYNPSVTGDISYKTNDIYVFGKYAYVPYVKTEWNRKSIALNNPDNISESFLSLQIIDISDYSNLKLAGSYDIGYWSGAQYFSNGSVHSVYVSGKYAYLGIQYGETTSPSGSLYIIDISDSAHPKFVSKYDFSNIGYDVYVSGNYAYVAASKSGLLVFNISNSANPKLVGEYIFTDEWGNKEKAKSVIVFNKYAYISYGYGGFQIIDVSNPSKPELTGLYDPDNDGLGAVFGSYISGKYAYVARNYSGIDILDISNPSNPVFVSNYNTPDGAMNIYVSGSYAYIADRDSGLQIIDVSNPSIPVFVGSQNTPGEAMDLYISNEYVYIADGSQCLQIIDISKIIK